MARYQKKSGFMGKAIISVILAAALAAGVCCMGYASRDNSGKWFGNGDLSSWHWTDKAPDENDGKPNPDDPTPPISDDGAAELEKGEQNGVQLLSAKIPKLAYAANGVNERADTAFTLTATVEPSNAVNKVVDWSVAWENGQSSWANGKEVTDYVTVTPTTDGATTATATCMQAFGERIIITAKVRDGSDDLKATCVANYVQKFLGSTYKFINHADEYEKYDYSWSFTPDNLNPEIDLIQYTDLIYWLLYCNKENFSYEMNGVYSSVYTKENKALLSGPSISYTEEYLAALRAAGKTTNVTAGEYYDLENNVSVGSIFFLSGASALPQNSGEWNAYRTSLKSNVGKVMFRVKCVTMFNNDVTERTIYNVTISERSLDQLATNISLDRDEIEF